MITKLISSLLLAIAIFIAPIKAIMVLVGLFIFLDTIFGVWASRKLNKPFLTKKLSRLGTKMFIYEVGVLLFYGIDVFIFKDFGSMFGIGVDYFLTKIVGMTFIGLEIFSIDEKIRNVKGHGLKHYVQKLITSAKFLKKEWDEIND